MTPQIGFFYQYVFSKWKSTTWFLFSLLTQSLMISLFAFCISRTLHQFRFKLSPKMQIIRSLQIIKEYTISSYLFAGFGRLAMYVLYIHIPDYGMLYSLGVLM